MSFFGLEANNPIEDEKRRFLAGESTAGEDIAVYNWGQEDYDDLGNALQEGGDELNDETFGGSGPIGKDFDFTVHTLPELERRPKQASVTGESSSAQERQIQPQAHPQVTSEALRPVQQARQATTSRESLWDDKSPFSVFRTSGSIGRSAGSGITHHASSSVSSPRTSATSIFSQQRQSPAVTQQLATSGSYAPQQSQATTDGVVNYAVPGARTLAEIEAEMRVKAQQTRELKLQEQQALVQQQQQQQLQQQQLQQLQQQQLLQQQQQLKPPRMRSQSPSVHRSAPLNTPQAAYRVTPHAIENYRQQQGLAQDFSNMRLQDAQRGYHKDHAHTILESQNRAHTPVDPIEFMLQKTAERERGLPHGLTHSRVPSQQLQQQQQLELQEQERRLSVGLGPGNVEELQVNLRRQIAADQQRQAQLAASGIFDQRRDTPLDQLHHQFRLAAVANDMVNKTHAGDNIANLFGGTNPAEMTQLQLQMQQRLLAQLAQQEFSQSLSGLNGANGQELSQNGSTVSEAQREQLRQEAMRKIMEAERQEGKRRRKAQKIAHMSRYNDLMTQGDKDFITRIQVSQLVTSDPYTEDFYAQVYGSLMRSRMGINGGEERVLKFGSGEGIALGLNQRPGNRRQNAMQRMEAQVERIVSNARQREKEKGLHAIHSLQGALGKTAGRSYKAAPRQLLQVDTNGSTDGVHSDATREEAKKDAAGAAKEAAKRGREALGANADPSATTRKEPLTRRECLIILEGLYDSQMRIEQLRRDQPPAEDEARTVEWEAAYKAETTRQWDDLRVMVPIETSDPHPFISLLMPAKGKKLLPRLTRHLSTQQLLQVICLLVACFSQLDVVKNAAVLDQQEDTPERREVDKQTQLFLSTVLQCILPVIAKFNLGVVFGMMGLLMEHCNMGLVVHSRPGQSLLTAFLSRAEVIRSEMIAGSIDPSEMPSEEDLRSWQGVIVHLFQFLAPNLLSLFPSSRIPSLRSPTGVLTADGDLLDQPVWKFLATFALHADNEQQQILVSTLREKILDNVVAVHKGLVSNELEQELKITNVNIFLHALGLDSSQINI